MIRIHGDYHLGQTAVHARRLGDHRLRGRAGAPAARAPRASARRCATSRACCARSPTRPRRSRSCADGRRRRTSRSGRASGSSSATSPTVDPTLLPAGEAAIANLLSIFELEKAIYELQLRARQPPRLGPDPGRRHRRLLEDAVTVATTELDALVRREHADPHAVLGAHPRRRRLSSARCARRASCGHSGLPTAPRVELEQIHPAGVFEGVVEGAELPLRYRLEVDYGDGRHVHARGSVRVRADARRARPAPDRRGPPRGALRAARRARPRNRTRSP